jgi:hypothetical protein
VVSKEWFALVLDFGHVFSVQRTTTLKEFVVYSDSCRETM